MDVSTQIELSYPNLQHILRAETEQVKNKKESSEGKVLSKLSLCRIDNSPSMSEPGPGDHVRFWSVGREDVRDISTEVDDIDHICEYHQLSIPFNLSTPSTTAEATAATHTLTLVRGSSLSLVDIPTFLSPSVTLGTISSRTSTTFPLYDPRKMLEEKLAKIRANRSEAKMGKRTSWTVMCVALGFFGSCLILVGGMMTITSDYQDRTVARMLNMSLNQQAMNPFS